MPKSITSSSIREFANASEHGLDSSLGEQSPGQLGPHGSWGFSPVGGNRLYSEGELVQVLSRKGKEDCPGTPDGACGHPERELPAGPLHGFWQPALGGSFFLGQTLREGQRSPGWEKSPVRWTQKGPPSPSTGLGRWG